MLEAGRIGVFGASGSGKSTYVKAFLRDRHRIVVCDPRQEYGAGLRFQRAQSLADIRALMAARPQAFRITWTPPSMGEAKALSDLSHFLRRVQEALYGHDYFTRGKGTPSQILTLVAEELNMCFPVSSLPRDCSGFADLCSRGRHYGIEIVGISQRMAEVNTRFRGNLTEAVIFQATTPRDIAAAAEVLGVPKDRVKLLQKHHYLRMLAGNVTQGKNRKPR